MPSQGTSYQPDHEKADCDHGQDPVGALNTVRVLDNTLTRRNLGHGWQRLEAEAPRLGLRRRHRLRLGLLGS